jgi:hypothetical protein
MSAPAIESATGLHPVGSQSPGPFQEQSAKNKEPKAPRRPNLKPETFNLKQRGSLSPCPSPLNKPPSTPVHNRHPRKRSPSQTPLPRLRRFTLCKRVWRSLQHELAD